MSVEVVLRRQAGVISRRQALAAGMSSSMISRHVSRGLWVRLYPRVYLAADHELTCEGRVRAVMLWAGPGAVLSGAAAAWWHGLWGEPATVEVTVPPGHQLTRQRGARVRRRVVPPQDLAKVAGVLVTAKALTTLEAAVELGVHGSRLLDRALQRRVDFPTLVEAHHRNIGRRGSPTAAKLLRDAADQAASEAERALIALLRRAGLTGWRRGYRIAGYEADLGFPEARMAIEVDGWAWHSDVERFRHDRRRQNALVLAGWTVLRFTWHDLVHRADAVITEIRATLTAGAPSSESRPPAAASRSAAASAGTPAPG